MSDVNSLTTAEMELPKASPLEKEVAEVEQSASNLDLLEKQLKLIQMCFYEYEFGVTLDVDTEQDASVSDQVDASAEGGVVAFDSLQFIEGKVGHGVPLEDLKRDLTFFIEHVRSKITHCVNTDLHTAFVDASGHLVGMQEELQYIERPLASSLERGTEACVKLGTVAESINRRLQDARVAEKERFFDINCIKAILLYERLVDTMESLDGDVKAASLIASKMIVRSPSKADASPTETCCGPSAPPLPTGLLERLEAASLSAYQLASLDSLLPVLPQRERELAEVRGFVESSKSAVHSTLCQALKVTCEHFLMYPSSSCIAPLRSLLGIFEQMGGGAMFALAFRKTVLQPRLEQLLSWKAATQARQSIDETVRLLDLLAKEMHHTATVLFPLFREYFTGDGFFPVPAILWPTACEVLTKKLVALYEVSNGDAFHKKYSAGYRLLSLAETCCSTSEELAALRQSPDVVFWNHKWNTDVYAALRIAEMEKALEPLLVPLLHRGPESADVVVEESNLRIFGTLKERLTVLFSDGVVLRVCIPHFLRQIALSTQQVVQLSLEFVSDTKTVFSSSIDGTRKQLAFLFQLIADATSLGKFLEESLHPRVLHSLGALPATPVVEVVSELFRFIQEFVIDACRQKVEQIMTIGVQEHCVAALQNIKSVRSAYSHTRKPLPTAPSWYVCGVTDPILKFVQAATEQRFPPDLLEGIRRRIVDHVADQFSNLARETLLTAKKTEESWEKLRKRKEASSVDLVVSSPSAVSPPMARCSGNPLPGEHVTDRDKMVLQLYIDASSIEKAVCTPASRSPSMEALFALLRRAEWIQGADIPEPPELEDAA